MTMTDHQPTPPPVATGQPSHTRQQAAFRCDTSRYPPMRMPAEHGAVLIDDIIATPTAELAELTGTWRAYLETAGIADAALALQLFTPMSTGTDLGARAHVALWIYTAHTTRWVLIRRWNNAGPGWPHHIAPWLAAATAATAVRQT